MAFLLDPRRHFATSRRNAHDAKQKTGQSKKAGSAGLVASGS